MTNAVQATSQSVQLLTLRRTTKYNYRLSVPPTYVRAHGLQDGAQVYWIQEPDGVRLKFIPPDELLVLTTRHEPVTASHGGEP
jgi:hypothetical protein